MMKTSNFSEYIKIKGVIQEKDIYILEVKDEWHDIKGLKTIRKKEYKKIQSWRNSNTKSYKS